MSFKRKLSLLIISFLFVLTSNTEGALTLPFWRLPILIVHVLREGASIMPLEELPTTPSQYFRQEKYLICPKLLKTLTLSLFFRNLIYFQ